MNFATRNDALPTPVAYALEINPIAERITTLVPAGVLIEGNLRLKEGGRIGGVVKGNVVCESGTLIIDGGAIVEGDVTGRGRMVVFGQVGTPERPSTLRSEGLDGLVISHLAQIHANVLHNGIASTNVNGQIQRLDALGPAVTPMVHTAPAAIEHNSAPTLASMGMTTLGVVALVQSVAAG